MESANLSFRQISLTASSLTPNFKARYQPHYQMRKAISEKNRKMFTPLPPTVHEGLRLLSSFTNGTGGKEKETCFFILPEDVLRGFFNKRNIDIQCCILTSYIYIYIFVDYMCQRIQDCVAAATQEDEIIQTITSDVSWKKRVRPALLESDIIP